ncbi:MAG: hypothetical protein ACOC7U_00625 [Spirochaetota bacterium]
MKTFLVIMIFLFTAPVLLSAGGEAETGRGAAMELVKEGQFVAKSFVDVESFLDDYRLEYSPEQDAAERQSTLLHPPNTCGYLENLLLIQKQIFRTSAT